jgi:Flp pilus assembly protein TadG
MWRISKLCLDRLAACGAAALEKLRTFHGNEDGASIIVICLTLPALIGALGLTTEVSYWRLHQRAMQNAADATAIAAATNASSSYAAEGQAVAAQYGFENGTKNVTVIVTNPGTAPGCTANCYAVTISDQVQLFFSQIVGYNGNATVNNQPVSTITANSVARSATAYSYCLLALASGGAQGITSNGAPKANMNGCNVMSNTGATCNGHNLNANIGDAHGTNSGCGVTQNSNVPVVADPYARLASGIPADNCAGSYPQEPAKHNDPALAFSNQWFGSQNFSGYKVVCGDQQLTADTTINGGSNGAVLVIENGQLDTRACLQLRRIIAQASCTAARKFVASLS